MFPDIHGPDIRGPTVVEIRSQGSRAIFSLIGNAIAIDDGVASASAAMLLPLSYPEYPTTSFFFNHRSWPKPLVQ